MIKFCGPMNSIFLALLLILLALTTVSGLNLGAEVADEQSVFRILTIPAKNSKGNAGAAKQLIFRSMIDRSGMMVRLPCTELLRLVESREKGYGLKIVALSYSGNNTVSPDLVPKEQFCEGYTEFLSRSIAAGKNYAKVVLVFENQQGAARLMVHEPKAHHVATCNSLLDCTHSLPFNVSTSNFVVGIDGSLCIIVEHFGTLKRQCLNGTFDANIQSKGSLQQGMEVNVRSPTADAGHLDSDGPLKISLRGSGKCDIILVPYNSQTL